MVARQPADTGQPDRKGLAQGCAALRLRDHGNKARNSADGKSQRQQLKRRHIAGHIREQRQQRPRRNCDKAYKCRPVHRCPRRKAP